MIRRFFQRLRRDRRGVVAVEIAMAVPLIATLALTGVEVTRFVLLNQKIERASATLADLIAQAENLSEADIQALFSSTKYVMEPYDIGANGRVIISSVSASGGGAPVVSWQRAFGAGAGASTFGIEGAVANLPTGFVVRDNESVIVTEVYYGYAPVFLTDVMTPVNLYTFAVFRPRFASLTTVIP